MGVNHWGKEIPWLDEMCYCEDSSEEDAKAPNNDVGDAEERVLAAHYGARGYDYGLCATVLCDGGVWMA